MKRNKIIAIVFLLLATVGLAAEAVLLATVSVDNMTWFGHIGVVVNILADVWLAVTAVCVLTGYGKGRGVMSILGSRIQGAITTYIVSVAAIFWALHIWGNGAFVSGQYMEGFVGIVNIFNNAFMPVVMFLIWLFLPVDRRPLGRHLPFAWIFPVFAYFIIMIVVGMTTNKFIYGFLNPAWAATLVDGTLQTLLLALSMTLVFGFIFYITGRIVIHLRNRQLAGLARKDTLGILLIDDTDYIRIKGATREIVLSDGETTGASVKNGDYVASRPTVLIYVKSAENGDAFSQLLLGVAYERGYGVSPNCEIAAKWYARSAAAGNSDALNNLGAVYEGGKGVPQSYGKAAELYAAAAELGNANAEYNLANLYYGGWGVGQDYVKAAELYRSAAEKGNAKAQNNLADCCQNGYGVPLNYEKAVYWNKKAAEQGDLYAISRAGICYETAVYPTDSATGYSIDDYKTAAVNGDAEAQFYTGLAYERGLGAPQDYEKAAEYYAAAAKKGDAKAQNKLGNCYYNGRGVPQDYGKAVEWYGKAAEQDDANALYNLGNCYYNGWGAPQDYEQAANLYTGAAEQGHAKAQNNLANCYEKGQGVPQSFDNAEYLYGAASAQGQPNALNRLGVCYDAAGYPEDSGIFEAAAYGFENDARDGSLDAQFVVGISYEIGQGVGQNYKKSAEWYKKAANGGNADAANSLGVLTQYGRGVPQDYKEAVILYDYAADKGDANALYNLGNCYYNGWGVLRDVERAKKFYKRAAEQGHAKAQNNLACIYEGEGGDENAKEAARLFAASAAQGNIYAQDRLGICREPAEYPERIFIGDLSEYSVEDGILVKNDIDATHESVSDYEAARFAEIQAGKDALRAAEKAERLAAEEEARRKLYEEKLAKEYAADAAVEDERTASVESFTVVEEPASDDGDESAIVGDDFVEVPDGYTYQDGWFYISETGEKVEKPIIGVGVRDEYYYNLPDELKPEFRELFVDEKRTSIPRLPSYVIDGDNTMFFRLVFTYITRYRKVISMELLDDLYEYLRKRFSTSALAVSKLNDKLIRIYFARRKDAGVEEKCENKCREDVDFCLKNVPNYPANLYSYKRLVMILENQNRLHEARALCETALELGLVDGTKAGYSGRMRRIDKKMLEI
jgi:TPR repeat protein